MAGLLKREKWKKSHQFTGSRIKGHIPIGLRFELDNGVLVTGTDIREQMDDFVYEYDHQFNSGAVKLKDIEYIEGNE